MKHFISVLGTGNYSECNYFLNQNSYITKYAQVASLELCCSNEVDKITICLTNKAREKNWENREYEKFEIAKDSNISSQDIRIGLKEELINKYGIDKIQELSIVTGKNQKEIEEMFFTIYNSIEENEEVYFDITHGLRNIPMLVLSVLEYSRVTKNIKVGGIFYGAFETGDLNTNTNMKDCPIFDLTYYMDILNWSKAADVFVKYGISDEIAEAFKPISSFKSKDKDINKEHKEKYGILKQLVENLKNLTNCIETGRGRKNKKSIKTAYDEYNATQKKLTPTLVGNYKLLGVLVDKISQKVKGFDKEINGNDKEINYKIGVETIKWSISNNMIQQGYTALEETLKTYVCYKMGVSDEDKIWRESYAKNLMNKYNIEYNKYRREKKEALKNEYIDEFISAWWEELQQNRGSKDSLLSGKVLLKYKLTEDKVRELGSKLFYEIPEEYVILSFDVSKTRNDINHFGFSNDSKDCNKFLDQLKKDYNKFINLIEIW